MKRKNICRIFAAAGLVLVLCGCEELSGGRGSQYQKQQYDAAIRARTDQLSATVTNLQNSDNELIRVINELNQKMAAMEQKNANLEKNIAALQQQLSAQRQEYQTAINKMIDEVSKEISKASASSGSSSGSGRPVGSGEFYEHKVESGQTLGAIAKAYNVSVQEIMSANRMKDSNLRVGQTLFVPKKK